MSRSERRAEWNQQVTDAMRAPVPPSGPAIVLHADPGVPDPAFAYRLGVEIDGTGVDHVPWGWSVHPLDKGEHVVRLWHGAGVIRRGSRATAVVRVESEPILIEYQANVFGLRRGKVQVGEYRRPPTV